MAEPAAGTMSPAEFFAWQEHQDRLYELVRGRPVPRLMTGATQRHDMIVVNALVSFRLKLRGTSCRPTTDDVALMTLESNIRRPDMTVDCGPVVPTSTRSSRPVLVLEVLSPSTAHIDTLEKLEEYKTIESLEYILIAETNAAHVLVYRRADDRSWTSMSHIGLESVLDMPALGCSVTLAELYEGVPSSEPRPL